MSNLSGKLVEDYERFKNGQLTGAEGLQTLCHMRAVINLALEASRGEENFDEIQNDWADSQAELEQHMVSLYDGFTEVIETLLREEAEGEK